MKKTPLKVAQNWSTTFFFSTGPAAQTAQNQKSRTPKSPLMLDWVFRLGAQLNLVHIERPTWPIRNLDSESNSLIGKPLKKYHFFSRHLKIMYLTEI